MIAQSASDVKAVYFVVQNTLYCARPGNRSTALGKGVAGPVGPWRVVRTQSGVAVYPLLSQTKQRATTGRSFPILIYDPTDGKMIQRLNFPLEGMGVSVQLLDEAQRSSRQVNSGALAPALSGNSNYICPSCRLLLRAPTRPGSPYPTCSSFRCCFLTLYRRGSCLLTSLVQTGSATSSAMMGVS